MAHNPYTPPAAAVADPAQPASLERPRSVIYAVRILWIGFGLGVLGSVVALITSADVLKPSSIAVAAIGALISFGISYWLFAAAWRGRGWSRIVQVVLLVLSAAMFYVMWRIAPQTFAMTPIEIAQSACTNLLNIVGTAMLFAPSASAWYRAMRASR